MKPVTFGLIVGNRGFFPDHLCESGRQTMLDVLRREGFRVITLDPEVTKFGSVETLEDARKAAAQLKEHRDEIDGIIVTLPNFGDERAIAETLRRSELRVPVLIHAFPDTVGAMGITDRRDSFCGKISVCNNLVQYGIPFSLTSQHTMDPNSEAFRSDLHHFAAVCRVVRRLRRVRVGAIGARPAAFNTVRYSEKILEAHGISVETIDLYELMGTVERLSDSDPAVQAKLGAINSYTRTGNTPLSSLVKMAKLGVAIDRWMAERELQTTAVQCWTALEQYFGVVPCTIMSMLSQNLMPSACEVDIMGAISMLALQEASGSPSAIVDWNNNYADDPNKTVIFHCSNLPREFFEAHEMGQQDIIAGTVGAENTHGTLVGRVKTGPVTYMRASTDDFGGRLKAYVGEGRMTSDPLSTFGGYGVMEVPNLQGLLRYICEHGFEHHVAINFSNTAEAIYEALTKYLGWEVYYHEPTASAAR